MKKQRYTMWELTGTKKGIDMVISFEDVCIKKLGDDKCRSIGRILYKCNPKTMTQWKKKLSSIKKSMSKRNFLKLKWKISKEC